MTPFSYLNLAFLSSNIENTKADIVAPQDWIRGESHVCILPAQISPVSPQPFPQRNLRRVAFHCLYLHSQTQQLITVL